MTPEAAGQPAASLSVAGRRLVREPLARCFPPAPLSRASSADPVGSGPPSPAHTPHRTGGAAVTDDLTLGPDPSHEGEILECLVLPLETRQEMAADLRAHRDDRVPLKRSRMTFTRRYGFMTEKEVTAWREGRAEDPGERIRHRTLIRFGYVYFDRDRTVAAARTRMEGPLGMDASWQVFVRRADGSWEPQPARGGCSWVS